MSIFIPPQTTANLSTIQQQLNNTISKNQLTTTGIPFGIVQIDASGTITSESINVNTTSGTPSGIEINGQNGATLESGYPLTINTNNPGTLTPSILLHNNGGTVGCASSIDAVSEIPSGFENMPPMGRLAFSDDGNFGCNILFSTKPPGEGTSSLVNRFTIGHTGQISSANNTLDDGSGNMTIAGNLTVTGNMSGSMSNVINGNASKSPPAEGSTSTAFTWTNTNTGYVAYIYLTYGYILESGLSISVTTDSGSGAMDGTTGYYMILPTQSISINITNNSYAGSADYTVIYRLEIISSVAD